MPKKPVSQRSPHELKFAEVRARKRMRRSQEAAAGHQHGDRGSGDDGDEAAPRQFVTGPAVCRRYRISDMSLWRWLRDSELNFPQPAMTIRGRRYWLEEQLRDWEEQRLRCTEVA